MKRLAIVGAGLRCYESYACVIAEQYSENFKIVSVCDVNIGRCEYFRETIDKNIRAYTDFDQMITEMKPDAVLITTPDCYHHKYIVASLGYGCDVYCEKPITIDVEKCRAIREAERKSGKHVTVTFNCRFMPYFVALKEIIASGELGKIYTVNYQHLVNPKHGGDYFKRWHRHMNISGGMMLHKSTHHFDIVNWILEDMPVTVCANGSRVFFGNGDRPHGERCSTCAYTESCPSYRDLKGDPVIRSLFFENEQYDGYVRDHCAFKPDTDIYDNMSVSVAYEKGTLLTYSLNMFSPREGFYIRIIGEKGSLELSNITKNNFITYRDGSTRAINYAEISGEHAGGDERLIEMHFGKGGADPLGQCAGSFDGIKSAMIGIAANESIRNGGRSVNVKEILEELK